MFRRRWILCACLAVAAPTLALASSARQRTPAAPADPASPARWGIRPVAVHPAAGGYLLYFRYRVLDADKARPLFDSKLKPYLVDRASGMELGMPEETSLGSLRSSPRSRVMVGKEYYVLFANSSRAVKAGSKVTVVLGDCRMPDLVVQ